MSITLSLTIITVAISILGFYNNNVINQFIFTPYQVKRKNQWYRFISSGFIHADIPHLLFNMVSLYMFSDFVESFFSMTFQENANLAYLGLYFFSLIVCLIPTYIKHQDHHQYRSLGASGAVSAVVFAGIFLQPTLQIGFFIIPPIIPGFVFGPIYLFITAYLSKTGRGNINHSAHLWGSLFGIIYLIITTRFMTHYDVIGAFVQQIRTYLKM